MELQQKTELYHFGVFQLDTTERRLWCKDKLISLTPKQFDLLVYFVENAGRIAKKSDLLDAVWADSYVEEATLARNISWLRSKLEEHTGGESLIETVPKLGYRFTVAVARVADNNNVPTGKEQAAQVLHDKGTIEFADRASEENDEQTNGNEERGKTSLVRRIAIPHPLLQFPSLL
jgi:DNA-binding winged helix-turn-helix (wHTH) protein